MRATSKIIGITGAVLLAFTILSRSPSPSIASSPGNDHNDHKPVFFNPSDLKWTTTPALPPEMKVSILYGDMKSAEPIGFRIKIPAGGMLAPHTHPVIERVTVISGHFAMGEGTTFDKSALKAMPVGSLSIFPTGCPMFGFASEETIIK